MRVTSKGQVTIPQEIRERFGLRPDTEVEFVTKGNVVQIVKSKKAARPTRGASVAPYTPDSTRRAAGRFDAVGYRPNPRRVTDPREPVAGGTRPGRDAAHAERTNPTHHRR